MWKYYKDEKNQVFAYATDGSQDEFIKPSLTLISEAEADELRKPPPPSQAEVLAAAEAKRSELLASTDWYYVREMKTGQSVPENVKTFDAEVRALETDPAWPDVNWPAL